MTLRPVSAEPFNGEAPLEALGGTLTPVDSFYVRNNFSIPKMPADWRLRVHGLVERPLHLNLEDLQELTGVERRVTLECAGNGRRFMQPMTSGTPWGLGAAGTAVFGGVWLRDVLELAGVARDGAECVFSGADGGSVPGEDRVQFQRSLPLGVARSTDPMLVWKMNGAPLNAEHGFPLRLIVPGYYAVASVKWLADIEVVDAPFEGHFQTDRYMYRTPGAPATPVTTMRVRSLITSHGDGQRISAGAQVIRGVAWSGAGTIRRVEVSVGDDGVWHDAVLGGIPERAVSTSWTCAVAVPSGDQAIRVRATDSTGETQPQDPAWNELGYGNNAIHEIRLVAVAAAAGSARRDRLHPEGAY